MSPSPARNVPLKKHENEAFRTQYGRWRIMHSQDTKKKKKIFFLQPSKSDAKMSNKSAEINHTLSEEWVTIVCEPQKSSALVGLEMADPAAAGLGDSISTVRTQRATNELTEETNLFKTALIIKASDPNTARPPPWKHCHESRNPVSICMTLPLPWRGKKHRWFKRKSPSQRFLSLKSDLK